jgi:L-serine dehydratase
MRFKDVFSIIGPSMIGPSSSHTAGAARLGQTGRQVLGGTPEQAEIVLYGSFATTYRGHGTDLAIVAGLLGFRTDDDRIKSAFAIAEAVGMDVSFKPSKLPVAHPNTILMRLRMGERETSLRGCSIGGGNIEIVNIDGFDIRFTAVYPTLLVFHDDRPGIIAEITDILRLTKVNIGYMEVDRKSRQGDVLTVIESDEPLQADCLKRIGALPDVYRICVVNLDAAGKVEE